MKYLIGLMMMVGVLTMFSIGAAHAEDDTCPCGVDQESGICVPCPDPEE